MYGKVSSPKKTAIVQKRRAFLPVVYRVDEASDEKSCDSVLTLSSCASFNVGKSAMEIVNCQSIHILPGPCLVSYSCTGFDIVPDPIPICELALTSCIERFNITPDTSYFDRIQMLSDDCDKLAVVCNQLVKVLWTSGDDEPLWPTFVVPDWKPLCLKFLKRLNTVDFPLMLTDAT